MASCGWLALVTLSCLPHKAGEFLGQGHKLSTDKIEKDPARKCLPAVMVWNSLPLLPMDREGMLPESIS